MKNDLIINEALTIPEHELTFTTSKAGGPGGQHVNKTMSRITLRWNPHTSSAFSEEEKARLIANIQHQLTAEGELILHQSESRSQLHNKQLALTSLKKIILKALIKPKKRRPTKVPAGAKKERAASKKQLSLKKTLRKKPSFSD